LVEWCIENGGDLLTFGWARRPTPEYDCQDPALVQAATLGQLMDIDLMIAAEVGDGVVHGELRSLFVRRSLIYVLFVRRSLTCEGASAAWQTGCDISTDAA
jgi:hypothetical protein